MTTGEVAGDCQHCIFFRILIRVSGIIVMQTHKVPLISPGFLLIMADLSSPIIGSWVCYHGNIIKLLISGEVIYYPFFINFLAGR